MADGIFVEAVGGRRYRFMSMDGAAMQKMLRTRLSAGRPCIGVASLLALVACAETGCVDHGVALRLSVGNEGLSLVVENNPGDALDLPADLLSGPRSDGRSVYIEIRNLDGERLERCAITEVEPGKLRDVGVAAGQTAEFRIPLHALSAAYCASEVRVTAVLGTLGHEGDVVAVSASNSVVSRLRSW